MKAKDLQLKSLTPQTVRHYRRAQTVVYDLEDVYVPKTRYPQFLRLERSLFRYGIVSTDYAYGLSEALRGWVKREAWPYVPMNVFCGSWAVAYFREAIGNREYVPPTVQEEETSLLVYDELLVARLYIERAGEWSFDDAVLVLDPALSPTWKYLYRVDRRTAIKIRALDLLCEEYGKYAISYDEFIEDANAGCLPVQ